MSRKASTAGSSTEGDQQPSLNPSEKKKRKTRPAGHPGRCTNVSYFLVQLCHLFGPLSIDQKMPYIGQMCVGARGESNYTMK